MTNKEIIDRASRIVCNKLDDMDAYNDQGVTLSKRDLAVISSALALAGVLCRINDQED